MSERLREREDSWIANIKMTVVGVNEHPELPPGGVRISKMQWYDRSTRHLPSRTVSPRKYMRSNSSIVMQRSNSKCIGMGNAAQAPAVKKGQMHRHSESSTGSMAPQSTDACW